MNGTIFSGYSFIDKIVEEYNCNQQVLNPKMPAAPKLGSMGMLPELSIIVPKAQQNLVRVQRAVEKVGFYNLHHMAFDQKNIEKALTAFDQRLDLTLNGGNSFQRLQVLTELYLQAIAQSDPGLHLVLTSEIEVESLYLRLQRETLLHGMQTLWRLAVSGPGNHEALLVEWSVLLKAAFDWKTHRNKFDYVAMALGFRLAALFPQEVLLDGLAKTKWLLTFYSTKKARSAVLSHFKSNYFTSQREACIKQCSSAIEEALLLAEKTDWKNQLQRLKSYLANYGTHCSDSALIAELDTALFLPVLDRRDAKSLITYQSFYLFTIRLCAITIENRKEIERSNYPPNDKILEVIRSMPYQLHIVRRGGELEAVAQSKSKTLLLSHETYNLLTKGNLDRIFDRPLRSVSVCGNDQKEHTVMQKIKQEALNRFPQDAHPFSIFCTDKMIPTG